MEFYLNMHKNVQQQESLRRLLNAVSLLSGAHVRLRRSRQDVRAFLQDPKYRPPSWSLNYDKTYVVVPSNTDPILAQFAADSDLILQRRKLQYVAENVIGRPPGLPHKGDLRKYIRIQDAGGEEVFSPPEVSHTATMTRTCATLYPGEIEVTEDFAERFHAPLFVKLFLFVILFDLDLQYLTLLMVAFVLHVHGVFEPIVRFFGNGHRRRQDPLDRVLQNLEQRRQEPAIVTDQQQEQPVTRGSSIVRALYQSVIMFIGTLLPWWTPDQRYLV